jgi:hypothetical protein
MGDELEEEFVNSWIRIEWFFGSGETWRKMPTWWSSLLRHSGYDRKLRAGQSLEIFPVSRSREQVCGWNSRASGFTSTKANDRSITGTAN